jgi:hypothetical protein
MLNHSKPLRQRHGLSTAGFRFIGEDLSYRPYFVEAAEGRPGRFFGVGVTRGEPGYYLSSPLTEEGKTVGVAVVKVSLEQLERSWATVEAPALKHPLISRDSKGLGERPRLLQHLCKAVDEGPEPMLGQAPST